MNEYKDKNILIQMKSNFSLSIQKTLFHEILNMFQKKIK